MKHQHNGARTFLSAATPERSTVLIASTAASRLDVPADRNVRAPSVCTGPLSTAGLSRRHFLNRFGMGLGGIALAHLLGPSKAPGAPASVQAISSGHGGILAAPHFPAKAKR